MKVLVSKDELSSLISKIQSVISPKPAIPILANVLIEAMDDQLIISATDLTVSLRAYADAKVVEEGAITLPARRFFQLIRELTAPLVEIHAETPELAYVNAGSSHFRMNGMHKNEYPTFPDMSEGVHFSMKTATLKEMLSRSAFAAAKDDSRPTLNGVLLQKANSLATFIGTDGKRLAKIFTEIDLPSELTGTYILPLKAVDEMVRVLDDKEADSKLTLTPDKISLECGSVTLISKLLSGQYPDVSRVIPKKKDLSIALHREELMTLLRQVSLFTSESNHSVKFSFNAGELQVSAMSGEIGEGKVSMPVNYNGSKLDIAFNPNYFLDILRHSKDETVHFDVSDSYNPGLVTDSSNAQFVIMPMRLEN